MSRALTLFRLQQTDSQLDRIRSRLATIKKTIEDDASIKKIIDYAETTENDLKNNEQLQTQLDREVNSLRIKIEQIESSLYGGKVRNPKELQDLQNDALAMKRHLSIMEEKLLEYMQATEDAQQKNIEAQATLDNTRRKWIEQNQNLNQEKDQLLKDIQKLELERVAITKSLADEHMALYERLRKQRQGLAVSGIQDNACNACGTTLTLALVQSAYSSTQITHCPSCGRILYGS